MWGCGRLLFILLLAVALVPLLALARRSVTAGWRGLWLMWAAARAARRGFAEATPGRVALRGRAVPIDPLVSEETRRRGVYLSYRADRWTLSAAMGGISGHWLRSAEDEEAAPFELTDGVSSVLVDPRGARILRVPAVSLEILQPDGSRVRYHEAMIEEGAEVVVIGVAEAHGGFDPSAAYRGHSYRLTVTDGGRGELVIAPPRGLRLALGLEGALRLVGALPALAVLALLVILIVR